MEQNIFQVVDEHHIDEILSEHLQELCLIMYSSKTCPHCKMMKPKFVNLSKQHKNIFFIYVDKDNFNISTNKYFSECNAIPLFLFYIGENKIAFIEGAQEQALISTLLELNYRIEEKKKELHQKEKIIAEQKIKELKDLNLDKFQNDKLQNSMTNDENAIATIQLMNKKIDILNKLKYLAQNGIQLSQPYNLKSNYEDMFMEYQFHTNPQLKQKVADESKQLQQNQVQTNQNSTDSDLDTIKKQQQVKQIQELNIINQKMQMQNLQKLQQLKRMQMMKEQEEKRDFERKD